MQIGEEHLKHMEFLLAHAAQGTHVLFDHEAIAEILKEPKDDKVFFNEQTMAKVQDVMTQLLLQKTYLEKMSYLNSLDRDTFEILVRSYFHMVEHAAFQSSPFQH